MINDNDLYVCAHGTIASNCCLLRTRKKKEKALGHTLPVCLNVQYDVFVSG